MLIKRMITASTRVKFEQIRKTLEVENQQIINEVSDNMRGGKQYLDMIDQVVVLEERGGLQVEEYTEVAKKVKKKIDTVEQYSLDNKVIKCMMNMD